MRHSRPESRPRLAGRVLAVAAVVTAAVAVLNADHGVPLAAVILVRTVAITGAVLLFAVSANAMARRNGATR